MTGTPERPWIDLAGRALVHAYNDRIDIAVRCVERIAEQHGADVIPQVMLAWVDTTYMRVFPDGLPEGYLDHPMVFWHEDAGLQDVDSVPPSVRFAGRFVVARLADDETQANALLASIETDEQWGRSVMAVLDVCSSVLRLHADQIGGVA